MSRKLGELGCDVAEARERMERLFKKGLTLIIDDPELPLTDRNRKFLREMSDALANPLFIFTYGQVTYAQDLYDRYCI